MDPGQNLIFVTNKYIMKQYTNLHGGTEAADLPRLPQSCNHQHQKQPFECALMQIDHPLISMLAQRKGWFPSTFGADGFLEDPWPCLKEKRPPLLQVAPSEGTRRCELFVTLWGKEEIFTGRRHIGR